MRALLSWVMLACALGVSPAIGAEKPNVLFIAIDDLNDWIGCLDGHPNALTPNMDRLASRGVLFSNAHCQAPICGPSRASLFTGLLPSTSGIYAQIPDKYLQATQTEKGIQTDIYQAQMLHTEFAQPLNVVIIVKTNLKTGAWAHVVLFSSDLTLDYASIIDFYSLRFQIEFNFRDAKQYWGLEDFMNTKETAVTNAANLSLFMVNLSYLLLRNFRQKDSTVNVLDLKAFYRGHKYVAETLKPKFRTLKTE